MAPEITTQRALPPDQAHRSDVYALGCLDFELLTGRLPFSAVGDLPMMVKHTTTEVPLPSVVAPSLGAAFDALVLAVLGKDPAQRTPSAEVFRTQLAAAAEAALDPPRILVCEDDDDFREALLLALRRTFPHAEVEQVADGLLGLTAFDRCLPSVAIADLQMPGLDGLALVAAIRERPLSARVPILVLTASGGPAEWKQLSALGADGFLVKPVNLQDVATLVRRAMAERTAR